MASVLLNHVTPETNKFDSISITKNKAGVLSIKFGAGVYKIYKNKKGLQSRSATASLFGAGLYYQQLNKNVKLNTGGQAS